MDGFGDVVVRLSHGKYVEATLHQFLTIPIPAGDGGHKVIVYGVVELHETGAFMARQLSEIKRVNNAE